MDYELGKKLDQIYMALVSIDARLGQIQPETKSEDEGDVEVKL